MTSSQTARQPRRRHVRSTSGTGVRRIELPDGLRVVTESMPGSRTFSLGFFVDVGSRRETPRLHGVSHFLEHLLFKGTRRRSAEEISRAIEERGGDINAYTTKEYTCFYASVLAEDAGLAADVLADMLTSSVMRADDVEAERAVILDEIAMHADDPTEVAHELVTGQLFGGRGLGLPVIGSEPSIAGLPRAQIVRHWRRHYRAPSIVVSAAGNVDHDRLVDALSRIDFPAGVERSAPPGQRVQTTPAVLTRPRRMEQSTAELGFVGVGQFDSRRPALGLMSLAVGGGMASRLFLEIRERRGLAYGIEAGETCYSDAGLWSVDWQCAPNRVAAILDLVRRSLDQVATDGITPEELRRAQGQMRGQTVLGYESAGSRMTRLGTAELAGDHRTVAELLAGYDAVTLEEVRAVAADVLRGPGVLALVGALPRRLPRL